MVAGLRYGPRPRIRLARDPYWPHMPWECTDGIYRARGLSPTDAYVKWKRTADFVRNPPQFLNRFVGGLG